MPEESIWNGFGSWVFHKGSLQDGAELDETLVELSALEMPIQRSITERAGKTLKEILVKAMDNYAVQSDLEWRDLVDIVNMTVNRLTNKSGFSPCNFSPRKRRRLEAGQPEEIYKFNGPRQ